MSKRARKEMVEAKKMAERSSDILGRASKLLSALPYGAQREKLIDLLRGYVINNNCSMIVTPEHPISYEHKLLIRDDCNGNISNIVTEYLSPSYQEALKTQGSGMRELDEYRQALERSVYRREMADYPSYQAIEHSLLVNLIAQRISPQVIKTMNISDFRDFVKEHCYDDFVKYREQNGFVKVFIRENEYEFYTLLRENGVHPAYVDKLIANMHDKGSADEFELNYKGQVIRGPGFDIDHKNPVYCPNDIAMYPEVNYPSSLAIVEKRTHRLKHKLERMVTLEDGSKRYEKILLPRNCAAMLNFEHILVHDFNNPQRRLSVPQPQANNLIYLNKIDIFTTNVVLTNENTHNKAARNYVNKRGGRK